MKELNKVARTFDELSERYERWFSEGEGELVKDSEALAVEKLIPEGEGLEVGVGSGVFASELEVDFGVDPAEKLLRKASSRDLKVVLGVGESLPFESGSFDFLTLVVTLEFLTKPEAAFKEARRVLRPGGKLIDCFIPKSGDWGELYREKKAEGHDFYKYASFYKFSEVESLLERAGFELEKSVSSLFQSPDSVETVEDPIEGVDEAAGFCCVKAVKS